jgi:hypothetical protein
VLLLLPAEGLLRGCAGRAWIAIRDMDLAAEIIGIRPLRAKLLAFVLGLVHCGIWGAMWAFIYTSAVEADAFEIDRSFQISVRKQVLRAGALTTVKLPFSDRIFADGRFWRAMEGVDGYFPQRRCAGTLGWPGDVTTQRRNLAVDQLQKQRQGNYRYKLKL